MCTVVNTNQTYAFCICMYIFVLKYCVKEKFTQKMKIFWKCSHPQAIQDVAEFVYSL